MSTTMGGPYAGIARDAKNTSGYYGTRCGYCIECNMPVTILGRICGYCIFENLLMRFIIENDVSILYV
jgi:hypothetical protein